MGEKLALAKVVGDVPKVPMEEDDGSFGRFRAGEEDAGQSFAVQAGVFDDLVGDPQFCRVLIENSVRVVEEPLGAATGEGNEY